MNIRIPLIVHISACLLVCVVCDVGLYASDVLEDDFFSEIGKAQVHVHSYTPHHSANKIIDKAHMPTATDEAHWNDPFSGSVKLVCHEQFVLTDSMCVKQIVADPIVSCPYGAFRNKEGVCVSVDSVQPEKSCPYGYEWYLKGCIRRHLASPAIACQSGFTPVDDLCVSRRDLSPKLICPHGFDPVTPDSHTYLRPRSYKTSTQCVKISSYESTPTCPDGFHIMDNNVCGRQGSTSLTCPERYTLEYSPQGGPMCVKRLYLKGRYVCPSDLQLNPNGTMCYAHRVTTPKMPCYDAGNRRNSLLKHITSDAKDTQDCMNANDLGAEHVCENGALIDGECIQDIGAEPFYVFEPLGSTYSNTPSAAQINSQCQGSQVVNENNIPVCEYVDTIPPLNQCAYESSRKSNHKYDMCGKTETVSIQYACQNEDKPSETGSCIRAEYTDGTLTCPDGADAASSGLCPSLLTAPMTTVCPDGYRDAYFEGKKTGMCENVEYANVQEVCPVGYERDPKHVKDNKKACVAEKISHPVAMCEPGFFEDGDKCVKTIKLAPSLVSKNGDITACRPSVDDSGPSCGMEMKYYGELTKNGKKKGEIRKKRFMFDRLV